MTPPSLRPVPPRHFVALLLMSMGVVLWEILLTRIYSVLLYYHFAFMSVSVAMFGLTLGAVFVIFRKPPASEAAQERELGLLAVSTGFLMALTITLQLSLVPSTQGTFAMQGILVRTYFLSALPFIPAGAFICILLTTRQKVPQLYACDLLGAGLACLFISGLLVCAGGPSAALLTASLPCLAAALCFGSYRTSVPKLSVLCALGLILFAVVNTRAPLLRIRWRHDGAQPVPLFEKWNAFSRIMITPSGTRPFGWGFDPGIQSRFPPIEQHILEIDSGAGTLLTRFTGALAPVDYLRYDVTAFAHYLRSNSDVLVIGPGGGRDLLTALVFRQRSVRGVEVNPAIVDAVKNEFGDFTGHLDRRPDVSLIVDEGRSYVQKTTQSFDIIQASLVDTVAATAAGAYSFVENGLYTVEAWRLFLSRLTPRGLLTFSRWYYGSTDWPVEVSRLVALGAEALRAEGASHPEKHLLVVRNREVDLRREGIANVLVSKAPFTKEDLASARKACEKLHCTLALADGQGDPLLAAIVNAKNPQDVYDQLPLDISPPTDDKPYFFFHARLQDVFQKRKQIEFGGSGFNLPAVRILFLLLGLTLFLAAVLIIAPGWVIFKSQRSARKTLSFIGGLPVYFALIGVGFMFIEIAWMQRFSLFLGHPTYGFTVILFSVLVMSAAGSWAVSRLKNANLSAQILSLGILAPGLWIMDQWVPHILNHNAGSDLGVRLMLTVFLIGFPAFLMGFYFPLGMVLVHQTNSQNAGWYWSINGALSVVGSVLAMLSCLSIGVHQTLVVGAGIYAVAGLLFAFLQRQRSGFKLRSA